MTLKGIFWHEGVNGLGVGSSRMNRLLPCSSLFYYAARRHDVNYDNKGNGDMRKMADYVFLFEMLKACNRHWQRIVAYVYFGLVRMFGWLFYRYDREMSLRTKRKKRQI